MEKLTHELFEEQAERTPAALAVVYEGQSLTYGELNTKANQLARYLRFKGIGPDRLVGICVERSLEMVVGLLGILKAGGAYVPLEPSYPPERLAYMLEDAAPKVLLTQRRLVEKLPGTTPDIIVLDESWSTIERQPATQLDGGSPQIRPDHLAYVIYTSGSTGRPKGVMIEHRGLLNYLRWATGAYPVEEGEGSPVTSPLGFDATITSLYTPLLCGRAVFLVKQGEELDGLERLLRQSRWWSLVKLSPAHLSLLGQSWPEQVPCRVRAFIIGGEALPPATVELWQRIAPAVRLINEYGPTETVVGCSIYEVPPQATGMTQVPIGRPIAHTQIHVLDGHGQPVPIGESGEIYIGGAGVARGYLNRPELTAERFVKDPFSPDPDARLYKSEDLGRWCCDGILEYLGRNDTQVKVRGFRVELGEIEAQLSRHPGVKDAVVMARKDISGEQRLAAYVVAGREVETDGETQLVKLREHLKRALPEYMIPTLWALIGQMPLTHNGKIDREALPEPKGLPTDAGTYVAPRTQNERVLVDIWKQVLGVDHVGIRDSFLDLGGYSLQAMKVVAKVSQRLAVELSVVDVLQFSTVEQLAQLIASCADAAEYEGGVI